MPSFLLWDALGIPPTKVPINVTTLASYVFPPVICYFLVAVLAVTPQTRVARAALWPVSALLALRAAISVDVTFGRPERKFLDIDFALSMFCIATRSLQWALAKEPLVRLLRPANSSPSVIMDAIDLASSLRGHGWEWSRGLYIPPDSRPTNRIAFAFCTLFSAAAHALITGALHRAILSFSLGQAGSIPNGSTIFDDTLPLPVVRYFKASVIITCTGFTLYSVLQAGYDLCTSVAVLFLGQDPAQWPPAFDAPWRATSLRDFWGRRWHQWFRHTFLLLGGYPLSFIFGRPGMIIGAFFASAVFHQITMLTFDSRAEFWRMLVGFGMMAPGLLAERVFYRSTGRKVDGVIGWIWTMIWLQLWGGVMIDGFARAGMFGCSSFIDEMSPFRISVEQLVRDFDAWLHTI